VWFERSRHDPKITSLGRSRRVYRWEGGRKQSRQVSVTKKNTIFVAIDMAGPLQPERGGVEKKGKSNGKRRKD